MITRGATSYEENINLILNNIHNIFEPDASLIGGMKGKDFIFYYGKNMPFEIPYISNLGENHICVRVSKMVEGDGPFYFKNVQESIKFCDNSNIVKYGVKGYLWSKIPHSNLFLCCFWTRRIKLSDCQLDAFKVYPDLIHFNNMQVESGYLKFDPKSPLFYR